MNFKVDEVGDNLIYSASYEIRTQIAKDLDKQTLEEIQKYCEGKNIIPNIIDADKLELVLKLGIAELNKRELERIDK